MPRRPQKHKVDSKAKRYVKPVSEVKRESAASRGYGSRWRTARQSFLKKNPLCANHLIHGIVVAATVVDHIVPHKGDMKLFWNRNNWQSLCAKCHNQKTARHDGGFGHALREGLSKS